MNTVFARLDPYTPYSGPPAWYENPITVLALLVLVATIVKNWRN